jgi:adenylate cyclase class 2
MIEIEVKVRAEHAPVKDRVIKLGAQKVRTEESGVVKKTRDIYKYDDITICFDNVEGLGEFVEVELVADSDVQDHREKLFGFLEMIGSKKEDSIRTSYLEMLMD